MSVTADEVRPSAADSAGISAGAPLAALADHPENPRTDLGDLTELTASILAQGLFEPLIVLTAAAYAREGGQEGYPAEGVTHVIVMGHRRAAAARLAELDTVPVIERDDLAGAPAIGDEARVRSRWASWDQHHIGHFERLARAGYEPTAWEQGRLAEAEACLQAAATLACQACGCTGAHGCPVRYDRDNELPVRECAWDCVRHKTTATPAE